MAPPDPLVATGHTLIVNCTVFDYPNGLVHDSPADYIFFTLGLQTVPSVHVHSLDSHTAQLRWPNMNRTYSFNHLFCYWLNMSYLISHEVITVAGKALSVTLVLRILNSITTSSTATSIISFTTYSLKLTHIWSLII